ncbi:MAG: twin-arginine translocase TatA/TatE family subunit [Lentimicrobiaceae bacterium]|nr:twin-arginine translocase TatA/TatE family subunit [Lentimicrobiaceae bacterium]MCP4909215.1 twin-arginine translocase TatA/TatE family subunit [Bacteroidota bacterium]MBT3453581.1 twin-arginine translocase TatA/TatE family subunit [Lentimicrobiaceae bacterium]MBT3818922.1 twin-arginine translocase TatA/TatE family subunit [Lentimicrobiaceae bacterium]MBT4060445.1 twin-arginine translocase TatA/TatE family subunit [Lentimicrobiaceae bacterium]
MRLLLFDFGAGEIMLVVLAILLVFGPSKIPEIARGLGKFINDIKHASEDIKTEINREADRIDREKRLEEYKASMDKETDIPKTKETKKDSQ